MKTPEELQVELKEFVAANMKDVKNPNVIVSSSLSTPLYEGDGVTMCHSLQELHVKANPLNRAEELRRKAAKLNAQADALTSKNP